jgi:hypothetical protein
MNDYEYFKAAIERAIARGTLKSDNPSNFPLFEERLKSDDVTWNSINVYAGYDRFVSQLDFNEDGSLHSITAWE